MPLPPPGLRERVLVVLLVAVALLTAGRPATARADAVVRPAAAAATSRWWAPLAGPLRVGRRFEAPPGPYAAGHRGVDLLGLPGVPVRAAQDGVVTFAGRVAGRGVVTVSHGTLLAQGAPLSRGALRTTYEPVDPSVTRGERVRGGDPIGFLVAGHAGCGGLACLHWGLLRGTEYLDPLSVLTPAPVRLLPLDRPAASAASTGALGAPDPGTADGRAAVSGLAATTGPGPTPGPGTAAGPRAASDPGTTAGTAGATAVRAAPRATSPPGVVPAVGATTVGAVGAVGAAAAGWRRRRQARGWARS